MILFFFQVDTFNVESLVHPESYVGEELISIYRIDPAMKRKTDVIPPNILYCFNVNFVKKQRKKREMTYRS